MSIEDQSQQRKATPVNLGGVASSSAKSTTTPPPASGVVINTPVVPVDPLAGDRGGVGQGDMIHRVTDFDLAVCLLSAGVELRAAKDDPPYTHCKLKNGQHRWVWNFHGTTRDGKTATGDLINGYRNSLAYMNDPKTTDTAFVGAMCALKNRSALIEHMRKSKPWVGFRSAGSSAVHIVIEGSKRAESARAKGMIRCDPFETEKWKLAGRMPNDQ